LVYPTEPAAGPAEAAPVEWDGRTVFGARGCLACHQGPGLEGGQIGPDLTAVAAVAGSRVPGLDAADYIRQSIREPQAFVVPGFSPLMPALGLSDEEIEAVVTLLLVYEPPPLDDAVRAEPDDFVVRRVEGGDLG
jgi:cytochrome c551/c552